MDSEQRERLTEAVGSIVATLAIVVVVVMASATVIAIAGAMLGAFAAMTVAVFRWLTGYP